MKFYRNIYLGDSIGKRRNRIIRRLKYRKIQTNIYVITFPIYGQELLEIYHANVLLQDFYRRNPLFVVGIAGSEEEAYELVEKIIQDVYQNTGGFAVHEFIMEKQEGTR